MSEGLAQFPYVAASVIWTCDLPDARHWTYHRASSPNVAKSFTRWPTVVLIWFTRMSSFGAGQSGPGTFMSWFLPRTWWWN